MRRIASKHEREKNRKRNQWVVGFILVFLMVTSTLGFALQGGGGSGSEGDSGDQNLVNYNGFQFENINGFWVWGSFVFQFNPEQVPDADFGFELDLDSYRNQPLYIQSQDPSSESEIRVNLGQKASEIQNVAKGEENCAENTIVIEESHAEEISQRENCIFISGNRENLISLTDQFLFKVLGIK